MKLYITILLFIQFIAIHGSALPAENPNLEGEIETLEKLILGIERVIEKQEDIIRGVPLDFNYNETKADHHHHNTPSAPGCPKSEVGIPYVYHGSPTQCHLAGERGQCKPYEKLFVQVGSHYGICNCDCFGEGEGLTLNKMHFCSRNGHHFVYHPQYKKCFRLHEQGPCKENEWLERAEEDTYFGSSFSASCKTISCPPGTQLNIDWQGKRNLEEPCVQLPPYVGATLHAAGAHECEDGAEYIEKIKRCHKNKASLFMTS